MYISPEISVIQLSPEASFLQITSDNKGGEAGGIGTDFEF